MFLIRETQLGKKWSVETGNGKNKMVRAKRFVEIEKRDTPHTLQSRYWGVVTLPAVGLHKASSH